MQLKSGPERVNDVPLKRSDVKKLVSDLSAQWIATDAELLAALGFEHPRVRRIRHSKNVEVYVHIGPQPTDVQPLCVCFDVENKARAKYVPSLYVLHQAPHLIRTLRTFVGVAKSVRNGSAFFLPGVYTEAQMFEGTGAGQWEADAAAADVGAVGAPPAYGKDWVANVFGFLFEVGDLVALCEVGSHVPFAVAAFTRSADHVRSLSGLHGDAMDILLAECDWVWSLGSKLRPKESDSSELPELSQQALARAAARDQASRAAFARSEAERHHEMAAAEATEIPNRIRNRRKTLKSALELQSRDLASLNADQRRKVESVPDLQKQIEELEARLEFLNVQLGSGHTPPSPAETPNTEAESDSGNDEAVDRAESTPLEIGNTKPQFSDDELTELVVLGALITALDEKVAFPLLLSTFSANFLKPVCSIVATNAGCPDWTIDWKKTQYKKCATFLREGPVSSFVDVREDVPGNGKFFITGVNRMADALLLYDQERFLRPVGADGMSQQAQHILIEQKGKKKSGPKKITINYGRVQNKNRTTVLGLVEHLEKPAEFEKELRHHFACQVSVQEKELIVGGHHAGLEPFLEKRFGIKPHQITRLGKKPKT
ncbi:hypothetical protein FVE85_4927 [Porphyridium purpureum]|uniref:eIF2D winged helix domain-containing protein n=1 Tax=Porphyridium purpureum TaxID=35688 RepID=A0A5J4YSA0_PORPP|nr:hypothetical protein FVE85_4927 [Porphyridium purpureum]|eukprot:POR9075..scf236_6